MPVDSFKYLPRLIAMFYEHQAAQMPPPGPLPFTPLARPLSDSTLGLVTSGGLYLREAQRPFDLDRERAEPDWGDPTYRLIPSDVTQAELGASHLHYNTAGVLADMNVLLPVARCRELAQAGRIGALAPQQAAFMGYQGFPPDASAWRDRYGPEVAAQFKAAGVDGVLLVPA